MKRWFCLLRFQKLSNEEIWNFNRCLITQTLYDPQYGATPLHKAVLFYQPKIVKLIAEKYRITTRSKDQVSV